MSSYFTYSFSHSAVPYSQVPIYMTRAEGQSIHAVGKGIAVALEDDGTGAVAFHWIPDLHGVIISSTHYIAAGNFARVDRTYFVGVASESVLYLTRTSLPYI